MCFDQNYLDLKKDIIENFKQIKKDNQWLNEFKINYTNMSNNYFIIGILSVLILFALISPKIQTKRILRVSAFVLLLIILVRYCTN